MKICAKWLLMSVTLLSLLMLTGCNKPKDSTAPAQADGKISTEMSDGEVTTKVKTALQMDDGVKGFDITVVTSKGDVRLTGVVDNQAQLDQIDKIVGGIEGVHSGHDELSIKK